jgi:hypothetical protein
MEKAVLEGFGPPDLIARVKHAPWTACAPSGKNFDGIVLGGRVLTDPPDELCPVKFRVTLETVPCGDRLIVEGYNARSLFDSMWKRPDLITFAGHCLSDIHRDRVTIYRATVEIVS